MRVKNPKILANPSQSGLDSVIRKLQISLNTLPWLEKSFGRAYLMQEKRDQVVRYPKVYIGKNEYFNVMPNDRLSSFSWHIGLREEKPQGAITPLIQYNLFQKNFASIFFLNLKRIDKDKDYIYTEELKEQILAIYQTVPGVVVQNIWIESVQDVYNGFNLREISEDLFYYPFQGIRIECQATYRIRCAQSVAIPAGGDFNDDFNDDFNIEL